MKAFDKNVIMIMVFASLSIQSPRLWDSYPEVP